MSGDSASVPGRPYINWIFLIKQLPAHRVGFISNDFFMNSTEKTYKIKNIIWNAENQFFFKMLCHRTASVDRNFSEENMKVKISRNA